VTVAQSPPLSSFERAILARTAELLTEETVSVKDAKTPGELAKLLDPKTVQTAALDLIDSALVDAAEGRCDRLMVAVPPQEGKSVRVSRRFPEFLLMRNPDLRIAIVSYAHGVARRHGRAIRDDITMHGPALGLAVNPNSSAAHEWEIAGHEGGVYCVGVTGSLTSRPVDVLIIDDPYKNGEQADSDAWQETVRDFWTEVALPRLGPGAIVIIVQTRWRDDDLTGWLQQQDGADRWRVINIPAQADHDPSKGEADPLGREPGDYLVSARGRTVEEWEQKRTEVGSRTWNALFQGRPAPASGNIFHASWFRYYDQPQWVERPDGSRWAVSFDEVLASWDMTFKETEGTDYVCGQIWARRGIEVFLLDQVHDRMSFVETCLAVRMLAAKWPQAVLKLVEDKANGPAVLSALAQKVNGLVGETPQGSKVARAAAVSPFVEAGNVILPAPELAPWIDDLVEEAKTFPRAAHDDRVDALSMALNRLLLMPLLADEEIFEDEDQYDAEGSISNY
jgi:predicted phage terminase large subunit-like protein